MPVTDAACLFLGTLDGRSEAKIEIAGFQGLFVLPQGRIV
jgi:hypothetical protein